MLKLLRAEEKCISEQYVTWQDVIIKSNYYFMPASYITEEQFCNMMDRDNVPLDLSIHK